ncbi:MAG TPA: AraC family transcriptional regulator ligand-binding domain-containing protein [Coleofasciculaceae cyanobacterium]
MNYIPLIRANILTEFVKFLEENGAPVQRLLAAAKLPPLVLRDPEALFPLKQVFKFYEQSAQIEEYTSLGFLVGQKIQIKSLGAFGRLLYHSLTLHDAIQTAIYMIATYNSGDRIWLIEQDDQVWLCRKFIDEMDVGRQQADQCFVMIMIHLVQLAAGSVWKPTEIHLETAKLTELNQFAELFDINILFEQKETAIRFPRSFLSLPLQNLDEYHDAQRYDAQRYKDYETLLSSAPATTFPGSIRQIIALQLREGYPDIQLVAEIIGVSVRTLQRHLNETNLTYSRLIDQVRFDRSVRLLSDPNIKLADVAVELGYSNAANFTRAFRRWSNISPSSFRNLKMNSMK